MNATLNDASIQHVCRLEQGHGQGVARTIIDIFLQHTPPVIAALEQTIMARDLAGTRILLCRLKGSALILGGLRLAALCDRLDHQLGSNADDNGVRSIAGLWAEYQSLAAALREQQAHLS